MPHKRELEIWERQYQLRSFLKTPWLRPLPRECARRLRQLFERATAPHSAWLPWAGLLWPPRERVALARTSRKGDGRTEPDTRSELEDWFMTLAEAKLPRSRRQSSYAVSLVLSRHDNKKARDGTARVGSSQRWRWKNGRLVLCEGRGYSAIAPGSAPATNQYPMLLLRCSIAVVEPDSQPPMVRACVRDARGHEVVIVDKEPIFVDGADPPGIGAIRCTELSRTVVGGETVITVSLQSPDDLETTDGQTELEVLGSSILPGV